MYLHFYCIVMGLLILIRTSEPTPTIFKTYLIIADIIGRYKKCIKLYSTKVYGKKRTEYEISTISNSGY